MLMLRHRISSVTTHLVNNTTHIKKRMSFYPVILSLLPYIASNFDKSMCHCHGGVGLCLHLHYRPLNERRHIGQLETFARSVGQILISLFASICMGNEIRNMGEVQNGTIDRGSIQT